MEETEPTKEYLKGFNAGYLLKKYKPEFNFQLGQQGNQEKELTKGLMAGMAQYESEQVANKDFSMDKLKLKYGKGGASKDKSINKEI